jgi:hypothetical protein
VFDQCPNIRDSCRPVETRPEGFTYDGSRPSMLPTHTTMDLGQEFSSFFL